MWKNKYEREADYSDDEGKSVYYVGELAEYFGVSKDTLRLYDKMGILSPKKDEKNGYRAYSRIDLICLDYVMRLRELGMPLEDIRMMVNACTIERAEAVMQMQDKLLEDRIRKLKNHQTMVRDYQKSFSNAIQNMGEISIRTSQPMILKKIHTSLKEVLTDFNQITSTHVSRFTFMAPKEMFLNEEAWENLQDSAVRGRMLYHAVTLIDDEQFAERPNFPSEKFEVIPPRRCVHAILKTLINRDYSDFIRVKDYIRDNRFVLMADPMFRALSFRRTSQVNGGDYYEFWAPIQ